MSRRVALHPIFYSIYPVLFAQANHIEFAPGLRGGLALLALFGGCAALLTWGAGFIIRDGRKAAIVISVFLIMFFSYGHLRNLLAVPFDEVHVFGIGIGPEKILGGTWAVVWWFLGRWLRGASPRAIAVATTALNRSGFALVLLGTLTLAAAHSGSGASASLRQARTAGDRRLPDIYYIILDDYARADILRDVYHYDNSAFVDWLRVRGFYVADDSRSNYVQTMLSLASSLNSRYLEPARLTDPDPGGRSRWYLAANSLTARYLDSPLRPLVHMIQYSEAARTLREHGYRFVALTSGFAGVQFPHADLVLRGSALTDFEESLVGTTPLSVLDRFYDPLELHRQHVLYAFDHLADDFGDDGPQFVFAHILSPHPPFIFAADGTPSRASAATSRLMLADDVGGTSTEDRETVTRAYRDQVQFVNGRTRAAIEAILARSAAPPIIILQGDHGSDMLLDWAHPSIAGLRERTAILNAYYVPPEIRARLYPRISPVNTFRVILGRYFAGAYELLPDETYFSAYRSPFELVRVGVQ
jgi:hypothetical protein